MFAPRGPATYPRMSRVGTISREFLGRTLHCTEEMKQPLGSRKGKVYVHCWVPILRLEEDQS